MTVVSSSSVPQFSIKAINRSSFSFCRLMSSISSHLLRLQFRRALIVQSTTNWLEINDLGTEGNWIDGRALGEGLEHHSSGSGGWGFWFCWEGAERLALMDSARPRQADEL